MSSEQIPENQYTFITAEVRTPFRKRSLGNDFGDDDDDDDDDDDVDDVDDDDDVDVDVDVDVDDDDEGEEEGGHAQRKI